MHILNMEDTVIDKNCFISYDDSFEYASVMEIIYEYIDKHPSHLITNLKIVKLNNKKFMKYALLFTISSKYYTHISNFFNKNTISIQQSSTKVTKQMECISEFN
jgi:hypothetical protein